MKSQIVLSFLHVSLNVYGWSDGAINLDDSYTRGGLPAFIPWSTSPLIATMI